MSMGKSELFLWNCVFAVLLCSGCEKDVGNQKKLAKGQMIVISSEGAYRTNDIGSGYLRMKRLVGELTERSQTHPMEMRYDVSLGIMHGRLFMMANTIGETNAAGEHFKWSAYYFGRERRAANLEPTNYSREYIEALVGQWDEMKSAVK